jgi:hypothetical protein
MYDDSSDDALIKVYDVDDADYTNDAAVLLEHQREMWNRIR